MLKQSRKRDYKANGPETHLLSVNLKSRGLKGKDTNPTNPPKTAQDRLGAVLATAEVETHK